MSAFLVDWQSSIPLSDHHRSLMSAGYLYSVETHSLLFFTFSPRVFSFSWLSPKRPLSQTYKNSPTPTHIHFQYPFALILFLILSYLSSLSKNGKNNHIDKGIYSIYRGGTSSSLISLRISTGDLLVTRGTSPRVWVENERGSSADQLCWWKVSGCWGRNVGRKCGTTARNAGRRRETWDDGEKRGMTVTKRRTTTRNLGRWWETQDSRERGVIVQQALLTMAPDFSWGRLGMKGKGEVDLFVTPIKYRLYIC